MDQFLKAIEAMGKLSSLIAMLAKAIKSGDVERVDEILPERLRIELAGHVAEQEAIEKYGEDE